MKRFFVGLGRFLRKFCGIIFAIAACIYVCVAIFEPELRTPMIVAAVVCAGLAWLLLKKKKPTDAPNAPDQTTGGINVSFAPQEVPAETLKAMRKHYTPMQASNDARILADSFQLCQQTCNFDTFFSRLQLASRCALTLLQAKKAGCKINPQTVKSCESALSARDALMLDFLDRIFEKETGAALQLKTEAGQRRRLEAFLSELQEHEVDFVPIENAYNEYLEKVRRLIP